MEIISDKTSHYIVVAAGPGSGKTKVLVHKLASLLLLEDVKHEQLLMLTFSRAAATEFKQRLIQLIGNAAHFVEIKTFHAYCFDLLGRVGSLEDASNVVARAASMISNGEVEPSRICKTVLVIDEAQDMGESEHALVQALIDNNESIRVIAVGDDDQNIYGFRGSDSKYMFNLSKLEGGRFIEMTENYRSTKHIVDFANVFAPKISKRIKKTPIVSMSQQDGWVEIVRHNSTPMYLPLVDNLISHKSSGTTSVLTQTNEEAVIMVALLTKRGINAKLVQSLDGMHFYNVAEVRYFMAQLEHRHSSPLISDEIWESAKKRTYSKYRRSSSLPYLQRCLQIFDKTNQKRYYNDFKEFVFESSSEDFCDVSGADVVVSTIHKAKGREFNDVYMLISDKGYHYTDEQLRSYYVGITRAKNRLFIHTNSNVFDHLPTDRLLIDQQQYDMPNEVALQLSYHDVYLDFFKNIKQDVCKLQGGDNLDFRSTYFYSKSDSKPIAKLSNRMQISLEEWYQRGYSVSEAKVRFIVAWRSKEMSNTDAEIAVLLPDLLLTKSNHK